MLGGERRYRRETASTWEVNGGDWRCKGKQEVQEGDRKCMGVTRGAQSKTRGAYGRQRFIHEKDWRCMREAGSAWG